MFCRLRPIPFKYVHESRRGRWRAWRGQASPLHLRHDRSVKRQVVARLAVWFTHIVTLGGYLHRSHREQLALPREAYSPSAWWSTMYVNRRGHDVSNSYTCPRQAFRPSSTGFSPSLNGIGRRRREVLNSYLFLSL